MTKKLVLKNGGLLVSVCVAVMVNLSLRLGQFPSQWKLANIIPLFKNDNRQLKVNYLPVSLLSSLSKLCEKIVFVRLYNFLIDIGYLYKFQSGFRPGA